MQFVCGAVCVCVCESVNRYEWAAIQATLHTCQVHLVLASNSRPSLLQCFSGCLSEVQCIVVLCYQILWVTICTRTLIIFIALFMCTKFKLLLASKQIPYNASCIL